MIRTSTIVPHWQKMLPYADDTILWSGPRFVVVLKPGPDDLWPAIPTIGRPIIPGGDGAEHFYITKGREGALAYYNQIRQQIDEAPYVYAWLAPNEPQPLDDPLFAALFSEFTDELCLIYHENAKRVVTGCFSNGWPRIQDVAGLRGVWLKADLWCMHEYATANLMGQTGLSLHHREVVKELQRLGYPVPKLIIGEFGLWKDGKGWDKILGGDIHRFLDQIKAYDIALQEDPYVWGAALFTYGPEKNWIEDGFGINEEQAWVLANYVRSSGYVAKPVWPPQEPNLPEHIQEEIADQLQSHIVPLNARSAFYIDATRSGLVAVSNERDITIGGVTYRYQGYRKPGVPDRQYIVYAPIDKWTSLKWFVIDN